MARYTGPVCRLCRRERTKLYLKGERCFTLKCPVSENSDRQTRAFPPGMHGRDRQFVRHGHVTINGKRVTIPSYRVRPGEVVALKNVTRENFNVKRNLDILDRTVPGWLEIGENRFAVTVRVVPQREQIDESIKEQLIVELYSK